MHEALPICEIALMDVDEKKLEVMHGFCQRFAENLGFRVSFSKTTDRKQAIYGADFVNTQIRVGGNAARANDERIPLSMGLIGQETTGAGGFAKGLRTIPVMLDIGKDVQELSPRAWIINYTNPTGVVTEAVLQHTKANIAGLCAGGMFAQNWTAKALGVRAEDVRYNFAGLNHMNFSYNVTVKGRPLTDEEFEQVAKGVGSVDISLILKLGALPSPYLQHYYHQSRTVKKMQEASQTRGEVVQGLEEELFRDFADQTINTKPETLEKRGGGGYSEVATATMNALYNNEDTWLVVNVPNQGVFSFLADEAVIETPCIINATGITPIVQPPPTKVVQGLITAVKSYETLTVEAAVTGCRDTALLALLAHPLISDYDTAEVLLTKILETNKEYLPAFFKEQ